MAGFPRSDLDANNWQTIAPDDWSWLDHVKAYGSDARNALLNLGSNLVEGVSPFHPNATQYGQPSLQVPPMIQGIADSYSRLAGTPSHPGNAYDLTGVKELDAPIQQDMSNVLLSLYGGNAAAGLTKPKGALGAGLSREALPPENALANHHLGGSQTPMQPQAAHQAGDPLGRMPDLSQGQPALAPRSLIENDPYLKAWADHLGLNYDGLLSPAIAKSLSDGGDYYYGIRTTPYQVNAGSIMPDSTQWYQDAVPVPFKDLTKSERRDVVDGVGHYLSDDEIKSRSWDPNYLDHGDPLGGASAREFIRPFRTPTTDSVDTARGYSQYGADGDFVHFVRSKTARDGLDRNEWVMPDAEVVAVAPYSETLFSDTGKPSIFGSALATAGEQPKGALGAGYAKGARPEPSASAPKAGAMGLSDVLAEDVIKRSEDAYVKAYRQNIDENKYKYFNDWADDPSNPIVADDWGKQVGGGETSDGYDNASPYGHGALDVVPATAHAINEAAAVAGRDLWLSQSSNSASHYGTLKTPLGNEYKVRVADHPNTSSKFDQPDFNIAPGEMTPEEFVRLMPTLLSDNRPSLLGSALATAGEQRAKPILNGGPLDFVQNDASYGGLLANQAVDHIANLANIPAHYMDGRAMGASIPSAAADTINTLMASKSALNAEYALKRKAIEEGGKTPFQYSIETPEGDFMGSANGTVVGDTMFLDWLGGRTPNSIGVSGVKALREQVRSDFPNVKKFQGTRISGARDKANATDRTQTVTLKSDVFGLPQPQDQNDIDLADYLRRYGAY